MPTLIIVIEKKGYSGLKEFTRSLFQNLNYRKFENYYKCSASEPMGVKHSEAYTYLMRLLDIEYNDAIKYIQELKDLGFIKGCNAKDPGEYKNSSIIYPNFTM